MKIATFRLRLASIMVKEGLQNLADKLHKHKLPYIVFINMSLRLGMKNDKVDEDKEMY
jgi:hypothetical protein